MQGVRRAAMVAVMVVAASVRAEAQLPSVQQVYDKYATAVGGRAAWEKVTHRAEKGSADITFANLSGTYERYNSIPNKMRMIIDLGVGKVEQGSDGDVVWNAQPDGSVAKMSPSDAAYANEANVVGAAFLDPSRFAKASVVGQEDFDGVPCYKVAITTKAGRERVDFFEVATGLRRGQVVPAPGGEQKSVFKDYKAFEGKMVVTKQVLTNAQGDIVINVASVTFTPNDPKLFELPAGIAK
ncbi:MAG: hypothetical protein IPP90_20805 [Gemmatimonadaceae bacterium]|nr:hypothetical protein [Gemmatimonadaceae bacterium]